MTRDRVREELRRVIRRRIVRETGDAYVCGLQTDLQLQRAIVELLDTLGEK